MCTALCSAAGVAQAANNAHADRSEAEKAVAILLADDGHAAIPGFVSTLINRLGDVAAVGVIQYFGERKTTVSQDFTSPEELQRILTIIKMSFEATNIIEASENRAWLGLGYGEFSGGVGNSVIKLLRRVLCSDCEKS